jgi:hypothetical protein
MAMSQGIVGGAGATTFAPSSARLGDQTAGSRTEIRFRPIEHIKPLMRGVQYQARSNNGPPTARREEGGSSHSNHLQSVVLGQLGSQGAERQRSRRTMGGYRTIGVP